MGLIATPEDAELELLAEKLASRVARIQNGGQLRGLYGKFNFEVNIQNGDINDFALESRVRFKPKKKQ